MSGPVKKESVPQANGYPNNIANTQTLPVRGTKKQTKGKGASKRMG